MPEPENTTSDESQEELYKKELEDFLYIVSHDLNAPLRHIKEFSKLLLSRLEEHIGPEEQQYVAFIEKSISKSELMIKSLLEYSRLSTRAKPWQEFDLNTLMYGVQSGFQEKIQKFDVHVVTEGLPEKYVADHAQILTLFMALFDNSIKFHRGDVTPVIKISCESKDGYYHFSFSDNGPGIDEHYAENVFEMFKRGETSEKVPGVGAGLSIAKQIIRRHGGKIAIDYKEGRKGLTLVWSHPIFESGKW